MSEPDRRPDLKAAYRTILDDHFPDTMEVSFGKGRGLTDERLNDIKAWLVPPGMYRIGKPGEGVLADRENPRSLEQAGHHALAAMMSHVDHSEPELERLESERRAEARRQSR